MEIFSVADIGEIGSIKQFIWRKPPPSSKNFSLVASALLGYSFYISSQYIFVACILSWMIWYQVRSGTLVEEQLDVVKNAGIQITRRTYGGATSHQLIQHSQIREVIINEGLTPYDVQYYIGVILQNENEMVVPFEMFKLQHSKILEIFYGAREVLF